jgi:hypothetical protein
MEIHRGEPLQVEIGDRVQDCVTGGTATVIGVDRKLVHIRYNDGTEARAPRLNYYLHRVDAPRRPPPGLLRAPLRSAGASRMPDRVVIHAIAKVEHGQGGFICEPYLTVSPGASPEEIGSALLVALDAFRPSGPPRTKGERDAGMRAMLKAHGVSSYRQLQERSLECWLYEQPDAFEFTALHNGGTKGDSKGYAPQEPMQWVVVHKPATAAELGEALLRTFELCTTVYESPIVATG